MFTHGIHQTIKPCKDTPDWQGGWVEPQGAEGGPPFPIEVEEKQCHYYQQTGDQVDGQWVPGNLTRLGVQIPCRVDPMYAHHFDNEVDCGKGDPWLPIEICSGQD